MKILRILGVVVLSVVVLAAIALACVFAIGNSRYHKMWTAHDATFPIPFPLDSTAAAAAGVNAVDATALGDAAMHRAIASGDHLIHSRLGCDGCHGADFGGGVIIDVPAVGYWAAPNLTAGSGSVTNGFSAHDWDLAVRHGIRHTGQSSSMPSTEFRNLSDHELSDVIAYIKSRPPVDRLIKPVRIGPVFAIVTSTDPNALPAFVIDHQKPHDVEPPPAAVTAEYGEHLVQSCRGCHNPKLTGGKVAGDPNMPIVANLTPDATGLQGWTEADFLRALREGKKPNGDSIKVAMPWQTYRNMNDVELKALWAYLQTLPAMPKGAK